MKKTVQIYGFDIPIPDRPKDEDVFGYASDRSSQYWKRAPIPEYFDNVHYDKDGTMILTEEQEKFASLEAQRCRNGFWFFNKGDATFITGKNYFYLQWWKLEDDIYADYRDSDRRYFLYLDYWEKQLWCLGVMRGKPRRAGASSQATSNLIYECIFFKNSVCGLVSKTEKDSKKTFLNMVAFGYRQLPVFLKPKQLNNKDSVSELIFAHKAAPLRDGLYKGIDTDTGHRSSVDFRAPGINTYDSGRLSRGLFDEGGKWEKENPFSRFISIVSKTMVKGVKRVGFMECPSTINEMTKEGGAEFKTVWDNANQFKLNHGKTTNRLVRYFAPAYDGLYGFIDKYGMSIVEPPDDEQFEFLAANYLGIGDLTEEDIRIGAKEYLKRKRENLTGVQLEEEIRQYPFDEHEMFLYAGFGCEFNAVRIQKQIESLEETPPYLRQIRMIKKVEVKKSIFPENHPLYRLPDERTKISFMDENKGGWLMLEKPVEENAFEVRGNGMLYPKNTALYQIGVDTTKEMTSLNGSKPRIVVLKKSLVVDGQETGMYPVAMYFDDTRLDVHFDEEVFKACMWYGCKANYEIDARADFYRYFYEKKGGQFLSWTPRIAQNPTKAKPKMEPGTRSGDPFQFAAQLQVAKMYIDGTDPESYNGHVEKIKFLSLLKQLLVFDNNDRTKSDEVIALMMALLPIFGETVAPKKGDPLMPDHILPTYKIKVA